MDSSVRGRGRSVRFMLLASLTAGLLVACATSQVELQSPSPTPTPTAPPPTPCEAPGAICSIGAASVGDVGDGGPALQATLERPIAVVLDTAANVLYVAETQGNRIRRIDLTSGIITTVAGTGQSRYPGLSGLPGPEQIVNHPDSLTRCANGWLYWGESQDNVIFGLDPDTGVVSLVAGNGGTALANAGPPLAAAIALDDGSQLTCDPLGNLLVADLQNDVLRYVNFTTSPVLIGGSTVPARFVQTIAGGASGATCSSTTSALAACLSNPTQAIETSSGDVWITDSASTKIRHLLPTGQMFTINNGSSGNSDGSLTSTAHFGTLWGGQLDARGALFLTDDNQRIRVANLSAILNGSGAGTTISYGAATIATGNAITIAGGSQGAFIHGTTFGDGSLATQQVFDYDHNTPAISPRGVVYVPDANNGVVRVVGTDGSMHVIAGFAGATSTLGYLDEPMGIVIAADGTSLLFTAKNGHLWQLDPRTAALSIVAGTGNPVSSGDGTPATLAGFSGDGIALDPSGNVFIADHRSFSIREVHSDGTISTPAGVPNQQLIGGSVDNTAANAYKFDEPTGVLVDSAGNLVVADHTAIRYVNRGAAATTVAGVTIQPGAVATIAGGTVAGFLDATGTAARFSFKTTSLTGLALANGILYVTDGVNFRIRAIDLASGSVTTIAGNGLGGDRGDGGAPLDAQLGNPADLKIAGGWIYWSQLDGGAIRRLPLAGGVVEPLAGDGQRAFFGDGGPALQAELSPQGIAIAADGTIYVADGSHRIRRIHP